MYIYVSVSSVSGFSSCSYGHSQCFQPFLHPLHKAQHGKGISTAQGSTVLACSFTSQLSCCIIINTLLVESQCFRPRGGHQPAQVFWDAGNCEDPSCRLPRAQNLQRFLPSVCIFNKFTLRCYWLDWFPLFHQIICYFFAADTRSSWKRKHPQLETTRREAQIFYLSMTRLRKSGSSARPRWDPTMWKMSFNFSYKSSDMFLLNSWPLDWQVFMKESLEQRLEKDRDEVRRQAAMIIRAHLLTFSAK